MIKRLNKKSRALPKPPQRTDWTKYWLICCLPGLLAFIVACSLFSVPASPPKSIATVEPFVDTNQIVSSPPSDSSSVERPTVEIESATVPGPELFIYPKEFVIFQQYLEVIGGRPGAADSAIIEAEVISIRQGEICPYAAEKCPIELYPSDWGTVRISKVISYTPHTHQILSAISEELADSDEESGTTSAVFEGPEDQVETNTIEPLQSTQELPALFLLSIRPVKIRYSPLDMAKITNQSPSGTEFDGQQGVAHQAQPGSSEFQPLPKEDDLLIFTTKIGNFPAEIEQTLPGLKPGDHFRAEVQFDGQLYIDEYELLPKKLIY